MIKLNLPPFEIRLKQSGDRYDVFDPLRIKFVRLTPEEWVRQHFVHFLINHLGYPQALLANEVSLTLAERKLRCDTLLYDNYLRPLLMVEYKSFNVKLTQRVLEQIVRYNYVFRVTFLIISNGLQHIAYQIDYQTQTYQRLADIPSYAYITQYIQS